MYKFRVLFTILIKHSAFVREPISMPFEDLFHESDRDKFYQITSMWLQGNLASPSVWVISGIK